MNGIIQNQLDRVEVALNNLIESITSYNPSLPAAHALLVADDTLIKNLKLRKTHAIDLCSKLAWLIGFLQSLFISAIMLSSTLFVQLRLHSTTVQRRH